MQRGASRFVPPRGPSPGAAAGKSECAVQLAFRTPAPALVFAVMEEEEGAVEQEQFSYQQVQETRIPAGLRADGVELSERKSPGGLARSCLGVRFPRVGARPAGSSVGACAGAVAACWAVSTVTHWGGGSVASAARLGCGGRAGSVAWRRPQSPFSDSGACTLQGKPGNALSAAPGARQEP